MKYTFATAALVATVAAQSLSDIPTCAQPCIASAVTSGTTCDVTDYKCICDNQSALTTAASACVISACGSQIADVLTAVTAFCAAVEAEPASSSTAAVAASTTTAAAASSDTAVASTTAPAESYPVSSATWTSTTASAYKTGTASNSTPPRPLSPPPPSPPVPLLPRPAPSA